MTFATIAEKVRVGVRITEPEALALFEHPDLLALGELAQFVNERRNGKRVFFNVNRHINHTNICVNRCRFCAFFRKAGEPGAYLMTLDEVRARAEEAVKEGATEIHVVGGLHPELPFEFYLELLSTIKAVSPALHVKAFTAVEIEYLANLSGLGIPATLEKLKEAGLGSLPGGGAEIFAPEIRNQLCPEKISGAAWLSIMEKVHQAGLKSNATMLYGHLESVADRVDHMRQLRELQDRTGGFQVFIPLAFQPEHSQLKIAGSGTSGVDDLRTLAVARIYLDNFANVKAYWVMLGEKIAQVSLCFGVNDLDGTVVEERIGHEAGADTPQTMSRDSIITMIRKAGRIPVERDTLYRELRVY
ncbi:Aminodeoxyfutalosine synthase [Citrifermentans bremense]|uniref:Aminodeoxyfutalosine synthase n=1 Tax=Citrifermentans bremense TaxID=60035 RepID=A0A6S6LVD9_9BACT|nr:aminofutalosine synthase MqnE [Citrifermentans bremense]BCG45479.1 Aminodeoxyfutalosine synthase [Citrifermentans bremense]